MNVFGQARINQGDDTVQNVVFKSGTNYFVLCEYLVVIPLDCLASQRCVVDDVSAIQLLESGWCHRVGVILDSG